MEKVANIQRMALTGACVWRPNYRWRDQFRSRGSRRESAAAQLFSLIWLNNVKRAVVCFPKSCFHFPAGFTTNYSESAAGTP